MNPLRLLGLPTDRSLIAYLAGPGLFLCAHLAYMAVSATKLAHPGLIDAPVAFLAPLLVLIFGDRRNDTPTLRQFTWLGLGFLVWMALVNVMRPEFPGRAWECWVNHVAMIATAIAIGWRLDPRMALHAAGLMSALAVLATAAALPFMSLVMGRHITQAAIWGSNTPNEFTLIAAPILMAWMWWAWTARPAHWKAGLVVVLPAVLYTLFVTLYTSRRATLVILIGLAVWLVIRGPALRHPRLSLVAAATCIVIISTVVWGLMTSPNPLQVPDPTASTSERILSSIARNDPYRTALLRVTGDAIRESFPVGGGYDALMTVSNASHPNAVLKHNQEGWFTQDAHNEYLQRIAEGGLAALLIAMAMGWIVMRRLWRHEEPALALALEIACVSLLISFLFHGIYHQQPYTSGWIGVITGLVLALGGSAKSATRFPRWIPWTSAIFLACAAAPSMHRAVTDIHFNKLINPPLATKVLAVDVAGKERELVEELGQWLNLHPCDTTALDRLARVLVENPSYEMVIDQRHVRRAYALGGERPISQPSRRPMTVDELADHVTWHLATARYHVVQGESRIARGRALDSLTADWFHVGDFSWAMIAIVIADPPVQDGWLNRWIDRMHFPDLGLYASDRILAQANSPEQLRAIAPLLRLSWVESVRATLSPAAEQRLRTTPRWMATRTELLRLLAQEAAIQR